MREKDGWLGWLRVNLNTNIIQRKGMFVASLLKLDLL